MNAPHARLYLLARALKAIAPRLRGYLAHQREIRITLQLKRDLALIVDSLKGRAA